MTQIHDDEFRLEFFGEVTQIVAISLEGFAGRIIEPVHGFEELMPSSRWSNQLLSADVGDQGFAHFVEKAFDSVGGVACPSAYFHFGSPKWKIETILEKYILEDDPYDELPRFSCQHDFGFLNPNLFELLPEIADLPECLVFTHLEKDIRYNFCCAGRGEIDLSKLSFDPVWKLPIYDGKSYNDADGDDDNVSRSFQFFRYGVDQQVRYSFVDQPLTAEQQEEKDRSDAEIEAQTKIYMEKYHDPDNPDPFQHLFFLMDGLRGEDHS